MSLIRNRALCALAIASAPFAASAQEAADTGGLETITVTAQRVESDIQTTPIAVSALTGDFLTQYAYDRVTSLDGAVPNLSFSASTGGASSQVSAFIRGVGEFDFLLTTDPAVGLYIDGVYLARTFGSNLELATRRGGPSSTHLAGVVHELRGFRFHDELEARQGRGLAAHELEEVPLRHQREELAVCRDIAEVRPGCALAEDDEVQVIDACVRERE